MIAAQLFSWWYGDGWRLIRTNTSSRVHNVAAAFSVPSLLKTLFAPWRRITTEPGKGIDEQLRAMGDNLVSRFVGFGVRCTVLLAAGAMVGGIWLVGLIQIILWPLVPVLIVGGIVMGIVG